MKNIKKTKTNEICYCLGGGIQNLGRGGGGGGGGKSPEKKTVHKHINFKYCLRGERVNMFA